MQLKNEELLQKQEAEAAAKIDEDKMRKELRANVVKREQVYKDAIGKYQSVKKYAEEMIQFTRGISREQIVNHVMESAHVRFLPTYETKTRLQDRFQVVSDAAEALQDAIDAESGSDDARNKITFDGVGEFDAVQNIVGV